MGRGPGRPRKEQSWIQPTRLEPPYQIQEPPVEERQPPESKRLEQFWPAGEPLPQAWSRERRYQPCPECRRVRMDGGGQAVILRATDKDVVYLRCKACGHQWKMVVQSRPDST